MASSPAPATRDALETPALLLDMDVLDRNIERMRAHLHAHSIALRPHVKTSKCIQVVRRALAGQPGGITVSTLREAEYFLSEGLRDILYAVCIAPSKLPHVVDLTRRGANLTVIVDSVAAAKAVARAASSAGLRIPVLIEIDADGHRSGVPFESPLLIDVGCAVAEANSLELRGVLAHAGSSYNCRSREAIQQVAKEERERTARAAQRLREAGLPAPVVSIGSTPTVLFSDSFEGVAEVRAGVYMFNDLVMAGLGVCGLEDIALSVLVSVIGHQPDRGWILTDGGWMALSRDRGTASQAVDQGYGVVRAADGTALADDLIVTSTNQEHGIIAHRSGAAFDLTRYPVGTMLRILPNHACATAAQHQRYALVSGTRAELRGFWERFGGW